MIFANEGIAISWSGEAAIIGALALASLGVWLLIFAKWRRGLPAVTPNRTADVPWSGLDLTVIIALNLVITSALAISCDLSADDLTGPVGIRLDSVAKLLTLGAGIALLAYRWRAGIRDFGLPRSKREFWDDLKLGGLGFLASLVPVYCLNAVASKLVDYKHPLFEAGKEMSAEMFLQVAGFSAVLVAPLWEEFLCRLVLQGWFDRLERRAMLAAALASRDPSATPAVVDETLVARSFQWGGPLPIVASAWIFSMLHLGQGAAAVPLFALAVILGYLYRQTQRILPCIFLHILFNGTTVLATWYAIRTGQFPGN